MKSIRILTAAVLIGLLAPYPASAAMVVAPIKTLTAPEFVETVQFRRGGAVRRGVAVGPRGGAIARRGAVVRPGYRPVPVRPWVRPAGYWWHPGLAVASGAAIGFATAAAATAYANSQPPAPGYCWFYTNPQRTQGFWDVCPP